MSADKTLVQAIYNRLSTDGTLLGLADGGVWFGAIPNLGTVNQMTLAAGTAVLGTVTLASPTWVEFHVSDGGELNDATGERFCDARIRVECSSFAGPAPAINADDRIDTLLVGWQPVIAGWANTWQVSRRSDSRSSHRVPKPVDRLIWRAVGVYAFRYGS